MSSTPTKSARPQAGRKAPYVRHGRAKTRTHNSWRGMIDRCENPNHRHYKNYGGRGIKVCPRWRRSFPAFLEDMGERPPGTVIERRKNEQGYMPSNCFWATRKEQGRNKRNNRLLTHAGRTATVAEWAELTGIKRHTIISRLDQYGWDVAKALTVPVGEALRTQHLLTFRGKTLNRRQWAAKVGLSVHTIQCRLRAGWTVEEALSTPSQQGKRSSN